MIPKHWVRGGDLSHHNGKFKADVKNPGFIMQRLTYADGTGVYVDRRLDELYFECASVPEVSGWHFWSGFQPLTRQVDAYLSARGGKRYAWDALDWEIHNMKGVVVNPLTRESAKNAYEWTRQVRNATGRKMLLYIQRHDYAKLLELEPRFEEVELWAKYWHFKANDANYNPDSITPFFKGKQFTFLQYGGDSPNVFGYKQGKEWGVESDSIDLDVFRGSLIDLRDWAYGIPENPDRSNPELMAHLRFQEQRILRLEQRVEALEGK